MMKIVMRKTSEVKPYERNPRLNDAAVDAVAASIKEFGWRQPIVVDDAGVVIAGHTRLKAAEKLGLKEVPVHVATDLTPTQVKAYRIADNKLAELAEWNMDLLPIELTELQAEGVDLAMLGFSADDVAQIMSPGVQEGQTDPDSVPAPPDKATSVKGEIYRLGDHRLMCGDSGSVANLDALLAGAPVHLVNMDPPYNVKVEPRSNTAIAAGLSSFTNKKAQLHHQGFDLARGASDVKKARKQMRAKDRPLENDFVMSEAFDKMLLDWFGNASRVLKPGGSFYIWGGYANLGNYPGPLKACGLYFSQGIVWDKQHPVLTRKDFMGAFEICFYGWKEGAGHKFYGPNNALDLWHIKKVNPQSMIHLTEKPVALATTSIQYSSRRGDNVLDLFGGSGSTLIGCQQTGRHAYLMELDTLYCDVIRQRWAEFVHGEGCDWKKLTPSANGVKRRRPGPQSEPPERVRSERISRPARTVHGQPS